ncbi:MAG: hypothetical protein EAX95_06970 [Candidatus Thorarchaeota archaeon]|nr:hypothetical protein [Candidatus Thorarchaeota archaeon]
MANIKEQLKDYLDLLNMVYKWKESEEIFELTFRERKDDKPVSKKPTGTESFTYTIEIRPGKKWIQIYCDVYPLAKIPSEKRDAVFLDLLRCNRDYAEVCFDFDKERGFIGTSQEMMIQGLNFDSFREEFLAVPWAVKKFWAEIARSHNLK